jgi:hypothetical protein
MKPVIFTIENGLYERKKISCSMGGWWGYTRKTGNKKWGKPLFRAYPQTPKETIQVAEERFTAQQKAKQLYADYCQLRAMLKETNPIVLSSKRKLRKYLYENNHADMVFLV